MAAAGEDFSKETAVAAARPSRAAMSARARVRSFALKKSGDQARLACVCVDCDGGGGGAGLKEMGGEREEGGEGERQRDFFFKKKKFRFPFLSLSLSSHRQLRPIEDQREAPGPGFKGLDRRDSHHDVLRCVCAVGFYVV